MLTEHIKVKLEEIVDFCESYVSSSIEIPFREKGTSPQQIHQGGAINLLEMEFEESKKLHNESPSFDIYDGLFKADETYHP